ncbi:MAG: acyl carrier protein [Nitrospirae bacterium]|nr:acyl carrier protein [Nitrospirota bacterium]
MEAIEQELRRFVIDNFLFGRDNGFKDTDSFLERGIIDSTGVLELVAFLEENYGISVGDEDLIPENLDSIANLVRFIRTKMDVS